MIKDVMYVTYVISFTVWVISTIVLGVVIGFKDLIKEKSKAFWKKVTPALAIICVISAGTTAAILIIGRNNLKKAVEETKTQETFLIENSVPLYLQEEIDTKYFYNDYEIEISEDGTYATLVPRNQKE